MPNKDDFVIIIFNSYSDDGTPIEAHSEMDFILGEDQVIDGEQQM